MRIKSEAILLNPIPPRYIPAGSVRVVVTESNETDLIYAGFERPDGGVAVVLLNRLAAGHPHED